MPAPEEPPEALDASALAGEGPDDYALALQAHLDDCGPCRAELEGLREVDRRVERLGAYVLLAMPTLLGQLDRQVSQSLGGGAERSTAAALRAAREVSAARRAAREATAARAALAAAGPEPSSAGVALLRRLLPVSVLLLALALLGLLWRR